MIKTTNQLVESFYLATDQYINSDDKRFEEIHDIEIKADELVFRVTYTNHVGHTYEHLAEKVERLPLLDYLTYLHNLNQ